MNFSDGQEEFVYCANSGSMAGLLSVGKRAIIWDSGNLKRKRRFTWRAIQFEGQWVGTDTHLSNRIVEEIIINKLLPELATFNEIKREQSIEPGVRVDFILKSDYGDCLLEVKSAVVVQDGMARYPDSKTPRGVKQLQALTRRLKAGHRAIVVFLAQRADAQGFIVSDAFDPDYAKAFAEAVREGLEVMPIAVKVSREGFSLPKLLPYG
jgi:sugar fermentation stimulation protein A